MDELERLRLRMQCLELAQTQCEFYLDQYGIERTADSFWTWIVQPEPPETKQAPTKSDDIPF